MKKHNLFKVVMITIAIAVVLSWLLPITYYSSSAGLVEESRDYIGIFDVMSYVGIAVQYFSHIGIYVLIIGGLYGVLHKISGYRNLVDKIVKGFKSREWLFMTIVMVIFAVLSSMAGLSLPLLVMFPFVIAVVLAMGYDKITAAMVTAGSVAIGLIGTVFNVNNTYGIDAVIGSTADGDILVKILLLVISLALLIFNVITYSNKHKDTKALEKGSYIPEVSNSKKEKFWPIVVILDVVLLILILAFISWDLFEVTWFSDALNNIIDFKIGDFPIFDAVLGISNSFGLWTLVEGSVVLLIASWLISFIYRIKFSDYITYFMNGAKRALKAAVLVVLVYVVLVCTTYVPTLLTIFKPMLELTSGINVFIMSLVAFISSIFSVELYYAATGVLPYVVGTLYTELATSDITLLSVIWQSFYGVAMLVAPTSVVLIATLSYLHIPYGKWLKAIAKLLLELVVVLLIIFTIMTII